MNTLEVDVRLARGGFDLAARFVAPGNGITVLFGPSGSGKTSLLSAIAGLTRSEGRIQLGSRLLDAPSNHVPPHRRGIGLVFQDARLFPHLSVRRNIAFAWTRAPADKRHAIEDVARFFDIASLLNRPVGNLSGGEKSRVALARALLAAPDFLLLDEPFAALDGARRRAFIATLLAMHRDFQLPMLVVTHAIDDAAALASHLVALRAGQMVASGQFDTATREPAFAALLDPRDIGSAVSGLHSSHDRTQRYHWLRADHIVLAGEPPRSVSTRNILEGEIISVRLEEDSSLLVELKTGAGMIVARVTQEAAAELGVSPGRRAWALDKAHML